MSQFIRSFESGMAGGQFSERQVESSGELLCILVEMLGTSF